MRASIKTQGPLFSSSSGAAVRRAVSKSYTDIARSLPNELKAVTPVKTGNMSKSWLAKPSRDNITIENRMKYSGYVYQKSDSLKTRVEELGIEVAEVLNININKALGG